MYPSLMLDLLGIQGTPLETIDLASRHGFEGVDLRLNRLGDESVVADVDAIRRAMADAGLKPGYCSLLPNKIAVDEEAWAMYMGSLPTRARLAQTLRFTRTASVVLPFHPTLSFDRCFDHHVRRVREAMPILVDHGLRLGLEYVSPITRRDGHPHHFIHEMQGALELTEACGPGTGLMLDSFHWHCAGETLSDVTRLAREQVVVVHLNDAMRDVATDQQRVDRRELPGASDVIDLHGFIKGLRQIGYDGPVTVEPTHPKWRSMDRDTVVGMTSRSLRESLAKGTS